MRSLALLLSSFGLAIAIQCPNGSSEYSTKTGNCYMTGIARTYSASQAWCASLNATLPMMRNIQDNSAVYLLYSSSYTWIGLTCPTSNPLSCVWDDGTPLREGDYQNFAPGHPTSTSSCIAMYTYWSVTSSGKWMSISCDNTMNTVCEYEYGLQYSLCSDGSRYFNGSCYFGLIDNSVNDGISRCEKVSGNIASIHSDSENNIVFSVARLFEPADATFIGLKLSTDAYSWSDGTSVDYKNFGMENKAYGNCVAMSLIDRIVEHRKWVNTPCSSSTPVNLVCKRPVEKTPVSRTVITPPICSSPIFLNGNGEVVSPVIPGIKASSCQYLVSVDAGQLASISFSQISLDSNSTITLFSNVFDKNPFATITATKNDTKVYKSSGNTLIMLYTTSGGSGNHFFGYFGTNLSPFANLEVYYGSGNFTSQGYPLWSAPIIGHEYRLLSSKNRIALVFKDFNSRNDALSIYDGSGILLDQIYALHNGYTISSFTNSMRLVFKTAVSTMVFSAEFISIL